MTETAPTPHPRRDIPIWISVPIILICLGGGAWFTWWYFSGEPLARTVAMPPRSTPNNPGNRSSPRPQVQQAAPAPLNASSADGVAELAPDRWSVKSGRVVMTVTGPAGQERFAVNYQRRTDLVNADQRPLMLARSHILVDQSVRERLKVTDDQVEKLRQLQIGSSMVATDADMEKLKAAWKDYRSAANRSARQPDLLRVLQEVSDSSFELTKKTMGERCEQVKTILTAEQLAEFSKR